MAGGCYGRRRLSELLQEQQEPFLVEAAKKTRRLRRGRLGGACCPVAACRRLLRLCNHGFKKRRGASATAAASSSGIGGGGLRSALSKVLCSKAMRRVLRWENLGGGGGGADRGEFRRLRRSAGDSGECDVRAMEFDTRWKAADMEEMDVDSSRQLSPVSVLDLELHSDDDSPAHSRCKQPSPLITRLTWPHLHSTVY